MFIKLVSMYKTMTHNTIYKFIGVPRIYCEIAKHSVRFQLATIVYVYLPILTKIDTHSFNGFSRHAKSYFIATLDVMYVIYK